MELMDFINKIKAKEEKKVKLVNLEVKDFGEIEFVRPREGVILEYLEKIVNCGKFNIEKNEMENIDFTQLTEASSEFVYMCCPMIQSKEVREMYKGYEPIVIPRLIFGTDEMLEIAEKLENAFQGSKTREKIDKQIKN